MFRRVHAKTPSKAVFAKTKNTGQNWEKLLRPTLVRQSRKAAAPGPRRLGTAIVYQIVGGAAVAVVCENRVRARPGRRRQLR